MGRAPRPLVTSALAISFYALIVQSVDNEPSRDWGHTSRAESVIAGPWSDPWDPDRLADRLQGTDGVASMRNKNILPQYSLALRCGVL